MCCHPESQRNKPKSLGSAVAVGVEGGVRGGVWHSEAVPPPAAAGGCPWATAASVVGVTAPHSLPGVLRVMLALPLGTLFHLTGWQSYPEQSINVVRKCLSVLLQVRTQLSRLCCGERCRAAAAQSCGGAGGARVLPPRGPTCARPFCS